ncbi:MAG TPA: hypothetical protein VKT72_01365 [Candidatus Baltobacteraceae bacterium]|nr:hypothetical protein [Candidatus Baltobacteraceae bacterium]
MHNWDWKRIGWIAGAVLLIWFIVGIELAGREVAPPPPGSQPITLRGGHVSGNHISTRSWRFDYTKAQMSPDGILATLDGVKNGVVYKKGQPYLSISAEHVSVNTQTLDFTATGDVHVVMLHPKDRISKSFDSDLVEWVNATKMLQLMHQSLFRTGDQTLRVATITVDFNTDQIHLGKVNGTVEAPEP